MTNQDVPADVAARDANRIIVEDFLPPWQQHAVRFAVDETFKGEHVANRVVWTGLGCGIEFEPGQRYLVYAYRDEGAGRDDTDACTRTRKYSEAAEDIEFLVSAKGAAGTIFGLITTNASEFVTRALWWTDGPARSPVGGAHVKVESGKVAINTATDASGQYGVRDLSPGRYSIDVDLPGFRFDAFPRVVDLKPGACSLNVILAKPLGEAR